MENLTWGRRSSGHWGPLLPLWRGRGLGGHPKREAAGRDRLQRGRGEEGGTGAAQWPGGRESAQGTGRDERATSASGKRCRCVANHTQKHNASHHWQHFPCEIKECCLTRYRLGLPSLLHLRAQMCSGACPGKKKEWKWNGMESQPCR